MFQCLPGPSLPLCQRSSQSRLPELHPKLSRAQHSLHSSFLTSLQPSVDRTGDKPTHQTETGREGSPLHSGPGGEAGRRGRRGGRGDPSQAAGAPRRGGEGGGEDRPGPPAGPGGLGPLDLRPGLAGGGGGRLRHRPGGVRHARPAGGGRGAALQAPVGRPGQGRRLRGGAGGALCPLSPPGKHPGSQHGTLRGCPGSSH